MTRQNELRVDFQLRPHIDQARPSVFAKRSIEITFLSEKDLEHAI